MIKEIKLQNMIDNKIIKPNLRYDTDHTFTIDEVITLIEAHNTKFYAGKLQSIIDLVQFLEREKLNVYLINKINNIKRDIRCKKYLSVSYLISNIETIKHYWQDLGEQDLLVKALKSPLVGE